MYVQCMYVTPWAIDSYAASDLLPLPFQVGPVTHCFLRNQQAAHEQRTKQQEVRLGKWAHLHTRA